MKMPVLFVGHGSPMNAIEANQWTKKWQEIALKIPKPTAILSVSAHWFTKGTRINTQDNPKVINDMYGFPKALYEVNYAPPGAPDLAKVTQALIEREVSVDNTWGIDHGTWSVLCVMYPERDIPVYQLSVDQLATPEEHYQIGENIKALREQGVLILGSGNVVHNLRAVDFSNSNGYEWAEQFDSYIYACITTRHHEEVLNYINQGESAKLSVPTTDHFDPLLYVLGACDAGDEIEVFNKACMAGSLSMTSYLFSPKI